MTPASILAHLRTANEVAREAAAHGHHPFGAVLVGPDDRVVMREGNIDVMHHAETELARRAAAAYAPDFLWRCTHVTTFEFIAPHRDFWRKQALAHQCNSQPPP